MQIKYSSIGCNILGIDKYFKIFLKNSLRKNELNAAEGLVLLALYGQDGQSQDQIIEELHYDKGVMTRTMQSLEKKGYVLREKNSLDNRSFLFYLTNKAMIFKSTLIEILQEWNDIILQGIDDLSLRLLDKTLDRMSQNAIKKVRGLDDEG